MGTLENNPSIGWVHSKSTHGASISLGQLDVDLPHTCLVKHKIIDACLLS